MRVYYRDKTPINAAEMSACMLLMENGALPPDSEMTRADISEITGLTIRRLESDVELSMPEKSKVLKFLNGK